MRQLCRRAAQFKIAYRFPQAHRTLLYARARSGITKTAYSIRCSIFMVTRSRQNSICARWHWCGIFILTELELSQAVVKECRRLPISMAFAIMIIGFIIC